MTSIPMPYDPNDTNAIMAQLFFARLNSAQQFTFQDLKDKPEECLASATSFNKNFMEANSYSGSIVLLSMEPLKFAAIQEDLDKFFLWFQDLIKSTVDAFLLEHPDFDFIEDGGMVPNQFITWLRTNLNTQALEALSKVVEIFAYMKSYAEDPILEGNMMRGILDSVLNTEINEGLSLRTVLEAMNARLHDS